MEKFNDLNEKALYRCASYSSGTVRANVPSSGTLNSTSDAFQNGLETGNQCRRIVQIIKLICSVLC